MLTRAPDFEAVIIKEQNPHLILSNIMKAYRKLILSLMGTETEFLASSITIFSVLFPLVATFS